MSILGLIFSIFFFGLLIFLAKAAFGVYRAFRNVKRSFRQSPFGQHTEQQQSERHGNGSSWFTWGKRQNNSRKRNNKIIPEDYGEYVDFTETSDSAKGEDSSKQTDKNVGRTETYRESQIEDAEWEEIK